MKENDKSTIALPAWDDLPDIDLYMDQVITLINKYIGRLSESSDWAVTPSMINNYVKSGVLPCPVKKKYSRPHLARLLMICLMKPVLPIQSIGLLMERMLARHSEEEVFNYFSEHYEQTLEKMKKTVSEYTDTFGDPSDPEIELAVTVMHTAAISGGCKLIAEKALGELKESEKAEKEKK